MCGRYTISTDPARLAERFQAEVPPQLTTPRFNAAPTQLLPVVLDADHSMQLLRWGLIPHWAEDASIGNKMINARAETIAQKPSFREAFRKRRCLVLADGYYEWQKTADGKQPMRFVLNNEGPFAFAGLWETWRHGEELIRSFTIITTSANATTAPVHNRMPVILLPEHEQRWLDPKTEPLDLHELLLPYPDDEMRFYPVSKSINSPSNEGATLIAPINSL
jgi:putative SOS response-associated peptidase YedK